jgi:hypothetical protein
MGQPLDDDGNPIGQPLDDNGNPIEQPGMLSRAWHAISEPLTNAPSRLGSSIENYLTDPNQQIMHPTGQGGLHDYVAERLQMGRGFIGGALHGLGDVASSLTSPINLGAAALSGGASLSESAGLPALAKGLSAAEKIPAGLQMLHGGSQVLDPEATMSQRGEGLMEAALGGAGLMHAPKPKLPAAAAENPPMLMKGEIPNTAPPVEKPIVPVGTNIRLKSDASTKQIKATREAGFEFRGLADDGSYKFTKTAEKGPQQPILEEEVGHARTTNPIPKEEEPSMVQKTLNSARAGMSTADMSAPLRQGLPLIHKKEFWTALPDMVRAFRSQEGFDAVQNEIASRPLFRTRAGPNGKILPSFAKERGLSLTGIGDINPREEAFANNYLEELPTAMGGGVVRGSERAYTAFLNKLRADTFESLIKDAKVFGADGTKNIPLANAMAEFVNNATGRGSLKFGKLDMEDSAKTLSNFLFSPRLMASRLQFANPKNLIFAPRQVRMEYYKSLMAMGAVGNSIGQLVKMSGAGTVESNPGSSDYGKIKVGDVRIDPYGGFQQYIVAAKRLIPHFIDTDKTENDTGIVPVDNFIRLLGDPSGTMKSTTSGKEYSLDSPSYGQSNRLDVAMRFAQGKAAPIPSFIMGLMRNKTEMSGQKMNFGFDPNHPVQSVMDNSVAQRFMPMVAQDLWDLYSHDAPMPAKVAAAIAAWFGAGVQTYGAEDFERSRMRQAED